MLELQGVDDMIDPASRELVIIDEEGKVQRTSEEQQKAFEIKRNFESFFQENQNNLNSEEERIIHLIGEQLKANPDINEFAFDRFRRCGVARGRAPP